MTDKCALHFFELPKVAQEIDNIDGKELWLKLFKAETEEDLEKLEKLGVDTMTEAVNAYRHVSASNEFKEIERLRSKARHDEAQALRNAERKRDEHWQEVMANAISEKDALIAELQAQLANK